MVYGALTQPCIYSENEAGETSEKINAQVRDVFFFLGRSRNGECCLVVKNGLSGL